MWSKLFRLLRYDLPLHFILVSTNWLPDNVFVLKLRGFLASSFFYKCGKGLMIGRNVTFYNPSCMSIGDSVYIAYGCWFLATSFFVIEDEVMFGPYVVVSPGNHKSNFGSFRFAVPDVGDIVFGKGSWIGTHSTILLGAHVSQGVLIGANSVLNCKTQAFSLYAGAPAKYIKKIKDEEI